VLVRPEAVVVRADEAGDAVVLVATFRGSSTRLRLLRGDGDEVLADVPSHRAAELTPGRRVAIGLLDRPVLLAAT
jgi:putative spermidine/putrescine transport system ATP-binding protein